MYIKLNNGIIEKYPYTSGELKRDNPNVSFPATIPESVLNEFGVFSVQNTATGHIEFNQSNVEGQPELVDGVWKQTWTVVDLPYEQHLTKVLNARANEYPPMADYLDGIVKGDQAQIDKYIADCLAVKAKYPKP